MWWGDRFHSWGIVLMGGGSSLSSKSTLVAPARAAAMASDRSTLVRIVEGGQGPGAGMRFSMPPPSALPGGSQRTQRDVFRMAPARL